MQQILPRNSTVEYVRLVRLARLQSVVRKRIDPVTSDPKHNGENDLYGNFAGLFSTRLQFMALIFHIVVRLMQRCINLTTS